MRAIYFGWNKLKAVSYHVIPVGLQTHTNSDYNKRVERIGDVAPFADSSPQQVTTAVYRYDQDCQTVSPPSAQYPTILRHNSSSKLRECLLRFDSSKVPSAHCHS